MSQQDQRLIQHHRRRLALLFLLVLILTGIAATRPLHRAIVAIIATAEPVIQQHAVAGAVVFVVLSAISAIVVFFSTAVVTPVAVEAFGPLTTLALLWLGWILGGVTAYFIGRCLGHRVASWFVDPVRLRDYERRAKRLSSFRHVLLFQLAVPSEIPGYVLGLAGCRFRTFVIAMALGELPFAIGAVYLGESFLERNYVLLLSIGIAGIVFSWIMFRREGAVWIPDTDDSRPTNDTDQRDDDASPTKSSCEESPRTSIGVIV
jgi:uncharacterized membrane protein YdjX (TVP38/TMEM64 family)